MAANAGADQTLRGGNLVTLKAAQTAPGIRAGDLTFAWAQTAGPTAGITLTGANTATATLELPVLGNADPAQVLRSFQVTITHTPSGTKATDSIDITSDQTSKDHLVIDSFTWIPKQGGTVTVDLADPAAIMQLRLNSGALQGVAKDGPGRYSLSARSTPQPTSVTVQSFIGNTAVSDPVTKTGTTAAKRDIGYSARFAQGLVYPGVTRTKATYPPPPS